MADRTHALSSAALMRVCVATRTDVVYVCACTWAFGPISLVCERVASHTDGAHGMAFGHSVLLHEGDMLENFCQHSLVYSLSWVHFLYLRLRSSYALVA